VFLQGVEDGQRRLGGWDEDGGEAFEDVALAFAADAQGVEFAFGDTLKTPRQWVL
jgi:ParB-like chromosome segregation protein Spo0J